MENLGPIEKESALHRAFQLYPKQVLGDDAFLLDLDCTNFRLSQGKSSRPDGIAALKDGRLAVLEIKLDATGKGDTSPDALAAETRDRVKYSARHLGPQTIRQLFERYERRYSQDKGSIGIPAEIKDGCAAKMLYLIAARHYKSNSYIDDILAKVKAECHDLPPFDFRINRLNGSVDQYGRVRLSSADAIVDERVGNGIAVPCEDDAELSSQHEWTVIPAVEELEEIVQAIEPGIRLRSKHSHVAHNYKIGMWHAWGIQLGDVSYTIDLNPSDPHCYLFFGKREDIYQRVRPLLCPRQAKIAEICRVSTDMVEYPVRSKAFAFNVHFPPSVMKNDPADIADRFVRLVRTVTPWVDKFTW